MRPVASILRVRTRVECPMRAQARAASIPAWPAPTTMTSCIARIVAGKAGDGKGAARVPRFSPGTPLPVLHYRYESSNFHQREGGVSDKAKTIWGGVGMMVGAVVWFVLGWMAGRIFFYPPILFVLGVAAVGKGLMAPAETK